ncbi:MAG: RNA polymerase sigma factor [Clostridia bacterium]
MLDLNMQMQQLKRGNNSALIDIYESTKKAVFIIAFTILRDYELAEDIMQETYIKVQTSINQFRDGTNAKAWINEISRNLALNLYNRRKKEYLLDFNEREDIGGEYQLNLKDESGIIQLTLKVLDDNESGIVLMHTIGQMRLVEIANMLNKPSGTVRWQYNNAIKKLKKAVEEEQ